MLHLKVIVFYKLWASFFFLHLKLSGRNVIIAMPKYIKQWLLCLKECTLESKNYTEAINCIAISNLLVLILCQ